MRKRIKTSVICLLGILLTAVNVSANDEIITLKYMFEKPVAVSGIDNCSIVIVPGLDIYYTKPGEPLIPFKTARILIPYGHEIQEIEVIPSEKQYLGKFLIQPAPELVHTIDESKNLSLYRNETIYSSKAPYPRTIYSKVCVQWKKGYQILILNLYPVQYIPATGDVFYFKEMTVIVKTKQAPPNPLFRGLEKDKEEIATIVDNPELISTYPQKQSLNVTYEYVIITNEELKNAKITPNLYNLLNLRKSQGLNGTIVTVEEIYSNYTGVDKQEKIRNFIKYAYMNWGTDYVLLVGDADDNDVGGESGDNIVPVRELWNFQYDQYGYLIASDLYYACLDGNYDANGNGIYGEPEDNPDLMAEVYVGRVPADSPEEVANFVRKIISYENISSSDPYLLEIWLVGEKLWPVDCAVEFALYKGNINKPEEKLNSLREFRDKVLKNYYIKLYYKYSPEVKEVLIENPNLLFEAAKLIVKYIPAVNYILGKGGKDMELTKDDIKEIISFTTKLKNELKSKGNNSELIKLIEEFEIQVNKSEGKTFSQALKESIYFEEKRDTAEEKLHKITENETIWGGNYKDEIIDGSCNNGYCTVGFPDDYNIHTLYDRDYPENNWPKSEIINIINSNVHIINHLGHSNVNYNMKMNLDDVDDLSNTKYFFGYTQGCYAGSFDNEHPKKYTTDSDSIIEHLITNPTGAFGYIANSRYGWFSKVGTNGPSQRFDREFWDAVFGEGILSIGKANQDSKEDNIGLINNMYIRYCYYELNLFGDPATKLKVKLSPRVIAIPDSKVVLAGNKLWGNRIIVNPTNQTLHFRCVNEIRDSNGILLRSWNVTGVLEPGKIWNKRGYIYVPEEAPSGEYTYTVMLYNSDTGEELDRDYVNFIIQK